ncbi:MAG: hypothetical protein COA32_15590 [Fluviicola sp.]|nr:MAG: hypothetical protein COA32_15590 [Fluviicola sp.]
MNLNLKILILFILNSYLNFGQFNIQSGYDLGAMKFQDNSPNIKMNSKWDFVNRCNLIGEYTLKNNFLFSINTGIDFHNILHDQERIVSNSIGGTDVYGGRFESNIQTFRLGFSIGYKWRVRKLSALVFKVNFHQFFINQIKILHMESTFEEYDVPKDEIDNHSPLYSTSELDNRLDYNKIGYRNKWVKENSNMNISIEYRYTFKSKYQIIIFTGYSPFDQRIYPTTSKKRNLFMFGLRLGYTLPQKNKENEK